MSWEDEIDDYITRIQKKTRERLSKEGYGQPVDPEDPDSEIMVMFPPQEALDSQEAVIYRLHDFRYGHPASAQHIKDKLKDAAESLMLHINNNLETARMTLVNWHDPVGEAVNSYLGSCSTALAWQLDFVGCMRGIAQSQKHILKKTRNDVRTTADLLLKALDDAPLPKQTGPGTGLEVFGAALAFGSALLTPLPGDELVIGFEIANRVMNVLEATAESASTSTPDVESGVTTARILSSALDRLDRLAEAVQEQEEAARAGLDEIWAVLQEHRATLSPPLPPTDLSTLNPDEVREIDPVGIRQAGETHLPTVAGDYGAATMHVASVEENEPHAFEGDLHSHPWQSWTGLRGELQLMLGQMATDLGSVGTILVGIADGYVGLENAQVEGYRNLSNQL